MAAAWVTISLLEGPTKAAVASLITAAGVGSTFLAASPNAAACLTFRQAYDDDIFQDASKDGSAPSSFAVSKDLFSAAAAPYTKKLRPIGYERFSILTSQRNLLLTGGRNVALQSLMTINKYLQQLYDAEEQAAETGDEAEYPPFPRAELKQSAWDGCINACLDWAVQLVRGLLDWAAASYLSLGLSRRIRKDLRASVARKATYPFYSRVPRVIRTSLFSEATLNVADWVVACCVEAYAAAVSFRRSIGQNGGNPRQQLRRLGFRCALQAGRCTAVWVAISCGNGLGSLAPRRCRNFSMFLTTQLAGVLVNMYANAFIARVMGGGPPKGPLVAPVGPAVPPADGPGGESLAAAAADAAAEVADALVQPAAAGIEPAAPAEAGVAPNEESAAAAPPAPPPPPAVQEAAPRRVLGGPRLPERRPAARRPAAGPAGVAGPGTPQAADQARAAVGDEGGTSAAHAAAAAPPPQPEARDDDELLPGTPPPTL